MQLYYQMGIMSGKDLSFAPDPRSGFEMALLRMLAFRPASAGPVAASGPVTSTATPARDGQSRSASGATPAKPPAAAPARQAPATGKIAPAPAPAAAPAAAAAPAPEAAPEAAPAAAPEEPSTASAAPATVTPRTIKADEWAAEIEAMGLVGLTRELALNCQMAASGADSIQLKIDPGHEQLTSPRVKDNLAQALDAYCGRKLRLEIEITAPDGETPALARQREIELRQQAAVQAIENDTGVQAICDTFGAVVDGERVRPVD